MEKTEIRRMKLKLTLKMFKWNFLFDCCINFHSESVQYGNRKSQTEGAVAAEWICAVKTRSVDCETQERGKQLTGRLLPLHNLHERINSGLIRWFWYRLFLRHQRVNLSFLIDMPVLLADGSLLFFGWNSVTSCSGGFHVYRMFIECCAEWNEVPMSTQVSLNDENGVMIKR